MEKLRGGLWKYFGAMIMETKEGQQALSLTRLLAIALFVVMVLMWTGVIPFPGEAKDVPMSMVGTFGALIGIKGLKSAVEAYKGNGNGGGGE